MKFKTASDNTFKLGATYIDKAVVPIIQSIIEKANEELIKKGIRISADINWSIDEKVKEEE